MTLGELFSFLDEKTQYGYCVDGQDAVALALANNHPTDIVADIVQMIAQACGCENDSCEVQRQQVVGSLGPIRLKFMADDAPVDGFRIVEETVRTIDDAFNVEALKLKGR